MHFENFGSQVPLASQALQYGSPKRDYALTRIAVCLFCLFCL